MRKIISFQLYFLLFILILPSFHTIPHSDNLASSFDSLPVFTHRHEESSFFGFIISLPAGSDTTSETFAQGRVFSLINDLLRENFSVGWLHEKITVACTRFPQMNKEINQSFQKGDFFVPFTGNDRRDQRLITVISDYVINHELEPHELKISSYLITSAFNGTISFFSEPRIAQHFGRPTRYGWPCYLLIAEAGGFFSFDFLLDDETASQLSVEKYNVFMWPYEPDPSRPTEAFQSLNNKKGCEQTRAFVRDGGGFIGSCYGALAASAGFPHLLSPMHLLASNFPLLSCPPTSLTLCLSDTLMNERPAVLENLYLTTSDVRSNEHPLTYKINDTVHEFFSGPWFVYLGSKTNSLASFSSIEPRNEEQSPGFIQRQVLHSSNWASSTFGNGKLVLFTSHPEFVNNITFLFEGRTWRGDPYYGRRVIFNALWHVVSKHPFEYEPGYQRNNNFINKIVKATTSLSFPFNQSFLFENITDNIDSYMQLITSLQNTTEPLQQQYKIVFNDSIFFPTSSRPLLYTFHFARILLDYCEKTKESLRKLDRLYTVYDDDSFRDDIDAVQQSLYLFLDNATHIAQHIITLAEKTEDLLFKDSLSSVDKYRVDCYTREMITTFEISLKYIPSMYFESAKTLRHHWYSFELTELC